MGGQPMTGIEGYFFELFSNFLNIYPSYVNKEGMGLCENN